MNFNKKYIYLIISISILVFFSHNSVFKPAGEIEFAAGFSNDMNKIVNEEINYIVGYSIYNFKENAEKDSFMKFGEGTTIGDAREKRQFESGKTQIIGLQKVIVFSEQNARFGLNTIIDVLFNNPKMNDRSLLVVCKGKAEDIARLKIKGYSSSLDFIDGMINNLSKENFFLDEYNLLNAYVILDSEGRNFNLPYLELENNQIKVTGIAVFKKDKMAYKLNLKESKIMNILRGETTKGVLTIQEDKKKYISFNSKIKRKVKCYKKDNKYFFDIKLDVLADILSNKLYKNIDYNSSKELENKVKEDLEKDIYIFINKMQNVYKMDLLQLGFNAASKFGRDTGVDWDKEISNSKIKVDVKVTVEKNTRGDY